MVRELSSGRGGAWFKRTLKWLVTQKLNFFVGFPPSVQEFLRFEQKLIHLPSVYWLTESFVRIMLLQRWQRWNNNHTLDKLLQGFRQVKCDLANDPWRQHPEKSLEEYLVDNNNNKLKTINLFTSISVRTWWEKKDSHKISSRGLTRAVLLWFHLSASSVLIRSFPPDSELVCPESPVI